MTAQAQVACVLVAGGRGKRLGREQPKSFVEVGGQPLVWHAMRALVRSVPVGQAVVVVPAGYEGQADSILRPLLPAGTTTKTLAIVTGGRTRQESVECGLTAVLDHIDVVLVHDAARCLAPPELYDAVAAEVVNGHDAVVPGIPVIDTLKRIDMNRTVIETPPRSEFMAVQTPQGFRRPLLIRAYLAALDRGDNAAPDDASLVESLGVPVQIVPGHEDAFKITRPRDLLLAESVLARQAAAT